MKRVCFLLNNPFTHDARVRREADALAEAEFNVTVVAVSPKKRTETSSLPNQPAHIIPIREKSGNLSILRILHKPVFRFHPFSMRTVKAFLAIARQVKPCDVVHAHDANMLLIGWALARLWGAKLVYDSHELWPAIFNEEAERLKKLLAAEHLLLETLEGGRSWKNPKWWTYWLNQGLRLFNGKSLRLKRLQLNQARHVESWVAERSNAIISVNDSILKEIQSWAIPTNPPSHQTPPLFQSIRNICAEATQQPDLPPNYFHQSFNLPTQAFVLLYQGMIAEKRGIRELIHAVYHLAHQHAELPIALVLMGPVKGHADETFFHQLCQEVDTTPSLHKKVFFHPAVLQESLLYYTQCADLGVHPILPLGLNHWYCLPNKLFEYIHAGLPIAASHFPEMKQIIDHYDIGTTFDPTDPQSITDAIISLLTDPTRYERHKANLKKAQTELTWSLESEKLLTLYNTLLGTSKPPRVTPGTMANGPLE